MHRLIAGLHMLGAGVSIGIHGHGFHTHASGSGGHAASDFATVGNQDFFEHIQLSIWIATLCSR